MSGRPILLAILVLGMLGVAGNTVGFARAIEDADANPARVVAHLVLIAIASAAAGNIVRRLMGRR